MYTSHNNILIYYFYLFIFIFDLMLFRCVVFCYVSFLECYFKALTIMSTLSKINLSRKICNSYNLPQILQARRNKKNSASSDK